MNTFRRTPFQMKVSLAAVAVLTVSLVGSPAAASESVPQGFKGLPATSSTPTLPGGELSQIPYLDLDAYQGTWHQVAALPHIFSAQCARDTAARYTLTGQDTVRVVNSCTDWFGNPSGIDGQARVTDPETQASLRVWFNGVPFQNPDGPTNYRVTWMSHDGQTVLVGSPDRATGFVLSRDVALPGEKWSEVRDVIADRGYNPCTFLTSPVTGGREGYQPLCTL
ncbi:lipocalin family protein [Corynebacterium meridianum]|uniref:Lipocalin family protein n=1 Tax=Corynebacterium meridianum TaxID=2765363 RepID=A0A934M9P5_9CORY|nr:lipocalin family protein [Corynebacterium meridianum]MBI8990425.1 lipocalin family protein [Corynebacterium meridianum]